ncbi:MAG: tetratricopeptide repeat protein [Chloroflexi bacterium]|nr:tetratricopeptide repeat protein [Chloroflexota bacterium]
MTETKPAPVNRSIQLEKQTSLPVDAERPLDLALQQAEQALAANDYRTTIAVAQQAIDLAQAARDEGKQAASHLLHGQGLWRLGETESAKLEYERALTLAQEAGLRQIEANSLRFLGMFNFFVGDYTGARPYLGQALAIERQLGNRQGEGRLLIDLGTSLRRQGDYARARSYLEQALTIQRELGDKQSEGRALGNLGTAYLNLGNYAEAKTLYEQSLQFARNADDSSTVSFRLYNLGLLSHLMGDNQTAWEYSQQASQIAQDIGGRDLDGYALTNMGHALVGLGRAEEAIDAYQRAVETRREIDQLYLAMEPLAGLSQAYMVQGALSRAQSCVEDILAFLEENTLDGTEEPIRVYLTCYRVLRANQDPRAEVVLNSAYNLLQKRAARIREEEMKRSFLENVAVHSEVLELLRGFAESTSFGDDAQTADNASKTKERLVNELETAHRRIAELEMVASSLRRIEETMWEGEERFISIAKTASDAILIFDTYEYIFFWNQAAQRIFGYEPGQARGQLLASIVSKETHQMLLQEMERVIETGSSDLIGKTIEVTGIRKDTANGTFKEFPLELSLATWTSKDEVLFTAIGRDITGRKQAEKTLQQAYKEVETQVAERTAQLEQETIERERAQAESLQLQQEVIDAQKSALQELSTPIIPVMETPQGSIIVMPLIGNIDTMRARDITRALLAGIRRHGAKVVILDITGVAIVDSGVASHLNKTIQAARLKGARTIITGISEAVAETIVELGIDWTSIETLPDLQTGLRFALTRMGLRIGR